MIFFKRKAGESLVIDTPNGEIVIQVLQGDELGIEVPPGSKVARKAGAADKSWLPARPSARPSRAS